MNKIIKINHLRAFRGFTEELGIQRESRKKKRNAKTNTLLQQSVHRKRC